MPKGPQNATLAREREDLIEARDTIKQQIEVLENPIRFYDSYAEGVAKLRSTLAEIENRLAELESDNA